VQPGIIILRKGMLLIRGGSKLFYSQWGKGHTFFGKEKITHLVDSYLLRNTQSVYKSKNCRDKQSYQSKLI